MCGDAADPCIQSRRMHYSYPRGNWFAPGGFVIGNQELYQGRDHVTIGYSYVLGGVLAKALDLPSS